MRRSLGAIVLILITVLAGCGGGGGGGDGTWVTPTPEQPVAPAELDPEIGGVGSAGTTLLLSVPTGADVILVLETRAGPSLWTSGPESAGTTRSISTIRGSLPRWTIRSSTPSARWWEGRGQAIRWGSPER